eukprot:TRINITY_DN11038_c0_g1_i1.p1 TRINITY_DN11038_c0_g1~~TRINITY_DN11038_c0_g1_i1.p1  ORF type:complete len:177 (+),score=25.38 TRINITY_DN11038_c0_g1_i1:3-533(+)
MATSPTTNKDCGNLARFVCGCACSGISPAELGVPRVAEVDKAKWVRLVQEGSEEGDVPCSYDLARCHYNGYGGLPSDKAKAYPLYLTAAREGLAGAQNEVGYFHDRARGGVTRDPTLATEWYRKAADQGNAAAQYNLAFTRKRTPTTPRGPTQRGHGASGLRKKPVVDSMTMAMQY